MLFRSWTGSPQILSWTNLPECMRLISEKGRALNSSIIWWQQIFDKISSTARLEQMDHILEGYAELCQLELIFIRIHGYNLIKPDDIQQCRGISNSSGQQKTRRNIAYIMCNTEEISFTAFYVTGSDDQPQMCFAPDDERIDDAITDLLSGWNRESNIVTVKTFNFWRVFLQELKKWNQSTTITMRQQWGMNLKN